MDKSIVLIAVLGGGGGMRADGKLCGNAALENAGTFNGAISVLGPTANQGDAFGARR